MGDQTARAAPARGRCSILSGRGERAELAEAPGPGQLLKGTVELQLVVDNELLEPSDELATEEATENTDRQEEAW
jgi:hypothetical protein